MVIARDTSTAETPPPIRGGVLFLGCPVRSHVDARDPSAAAPPPLLRRGVLSLWRPVASLVAAGAALLRLLAHSAIAA